MSGAIHFITMLDESNRHHGTFNVAVAQAPIDGAAPVTVIDLKRKLAAGESGRSTLELRRLRGGAGRLARRARRR